MATVQPVSAQVVGNAFVTQYYHILHQSPALVHRFYQDISKLGRPEDNGSMSITTTMTAINEKILSLNYDELRAEIKHVDAQESLNMGVHVFVTGYLTGKDNTTRSFAQSFFLAPQERGGYFVLNDMFRYIENADHSGTNQFSVKSVEAPLTHEQGTAEESLVNEDHNSEQANVLAEVGIVEEVHNLSENGEIAVVEEEMPVAEVIDEVPVPEIVDEMPVAEVVDEVPDDSQLVVESNIKIEEVPKKSFAAIVMDLKGSAQPFSSPLPALRKSQPKSQEQQVKLATSSTSLTEVTFSSLNDTENGINQEGGAEGYSIYIKGLPFNATPALLEEEFKKFGTIKNGHDGIQVRSKQGFCFGFVEFEEASAVEKAIEASPITLGGRQAVVEEKKSNSRGSNRGRFPAVRGPGFRNEGMRGRGNYVGGRGYHNSRAEFGGRNEFSNRGNNRGGGSSNRGGDGGYQSRANRANGMGGGGTTRNMAPRVPATA